MAVELEADMLTVRTEPRFIAPCYANGEDTDFEGHEFFEAPSMRKLDGRYYFIYSSVNSHELCYATSEHPMEGFRYGGTLVSNGDIFLGGAGPEEADNYTGNNHGSLVEIGGELYVFYHRHTNRNQFSRQGCAERVEIGPDGKIAQVEITSCGLNGGPLEAAGVYPAGIACHLTDPTVENRIDYNDPVMKTQIRVTERQNQSFITGIKDRSTVGWKYFRFAGTDLLALELRGSFAGTVTVSHDEAGNRPIGAYEVALESESWAEHIIPIQPRKGKRALYLHFKGKGTLDLKTLAFL